MVGMMAVSWGERAASLLNAAKVSPDIPSKMRQLRQLKDLLLHREPSLITDFAARLAELQSDRTAPVRRFLAEIIGEVGMKKIEVLPEMVPTLISFLKDETPAVVRQAIKTGTSLFEHVLVKVAIQGLYSSELDEVLKASWAWMLKFKNAVIPIATQPGSDGIRLLAIKFVEAMILLYTPDPNGSSDPPSEAIEGVGLNISWVRGGHPVLSVGDLAMEASQSLGLLLDQLRFPQVKSLSNSIIIVLVSSLSAVARKRPSFYGRILPVLLCLDPASSVIKGVDVPGAHHALKNAFVACLNCTHSSAVPWRARLVEALKAMNDGELAEQATVLNKMSGGTTAGIEDPLTAKDESVSHQGSGEAQIDGGRKRQIIEENDDSSQGDSLSSKRTRLESPMLQENREESLDVDSGAKSNNPSLIGSMTTTSDRESKPIQQLVSMFAALVAQGDKAAQSLEILISSISSDLLTEVVVANMRHLPPSCPKAVEEEMALHSGNQLVMQASALVADILSLSTGLPLIASLLASRSSMSHDIAKSDHCNEEKAITTADSAFVSTTVHNEIATRATGFPSSSIPNSPGTENASLAVFEEDAQKFESGIPGLDSNNSLDEIQESLDASHTSVDLQRTSQEQVLSSSGALPQEFSSSGCMATSDSERFRLIDTTAESGQVASATSSQYFLPKMALQDVNLSDEEKDCLQKEAFVRILEAYKQIEVSGNLTPRFSLLANLGVEFPLELDPWALLQKHVVSDYVSHEGHELTLRVLYRLYRETEQDHDFLSSRTAASVYEVFLLTVAQTLRDTFPASDKSLGRLLADVPYLPEGVLNVLESLCSPASNEKVDKDFQSGDRVTQGLSAVWSLILLRPSNRERCLLIALHSAVHLIEEVRMKAIRLVANKLFPLPSICKRIEDFANEQLHSVIQDTDTIDVAGSADVVHKDSDLEVSSTGVQPSASVAASKVVCSPTSSSSSLLSEAQRHMSLYFALCTKRHSLLHQIFAIYHRLPKAARQAAHRQIPILVRTIGSSTELLAIISDPPSGSENLLMQVLQTLTDGAIPSSDLIFCVRKLYNSKMKDVEILIPILSYLPKDEVLPVIPDLVNLPPDKFQVALTRVLQGSPHTGPSLAPAEVLIAIHGIDPEKDKIPLKKVMDACSACFELRDVFTQQVLAKVLNQLVEQIPLPLLFMRTVIQAIGVFPALVEFIMEILSRLVSKQIWKYPKLWVGFLKCAIQTKPQSFNVLLQLPAAQLENALNKNPVLRSPLVEHANQPNIRQTLPRSTLVVLGLVNDSQTSRHPQTSQSQATDASGSAADAATEVTEVTQESTGLS